MGEMQASVIQCLENKASNVSSPPSRLHSFVSLVLAITARFCHATYKVLNKLHSFRIPVVRWKFHSNCFFPKIVTVRYRLPRVCLLDYNNLKYFKVSLALYQRNNSKMHRHKDLQAIYLKYLHLLFKWKRKVTLTFPLYLYSVWSNGFIDWMKLKLNGKRFWGFF